MIGHPCFRPISSHIPSLHLPNGGICCNLLWRDVRGHALTLDSLDFGIQLGCLKILCFIICFRLRLPWGITLKDVKYRTCSMIELYRARSSWLCRPHRLTYKLYVSIFFYIFFTIVCNVHCLLPAWLFASLLVCTLQKYHGHGANSPTHCDVCTKLSGGPFVCAISSAHAELSHSGTRPNRPRILFNVGHCPTHCVPTASPHQCIKAAYNMWVPSFENIGLSLEIMDLDQSY